MTLKELQEKLAEFPEDLQDAQVALTDPNTAQAYPVDFVEQFVTCDFQIVEEEVDNDFYYHTIIISSGG